MLYLRFKMAETKGRVGNLSSNLFSYHILFFFSCEGKRFSFRFCVSPHADTAFIDLVQAETPLAYHPLPS